MRVLRLLSKGIVYAALCGTALGQIFTVTVNSSGATNITTTVQANVVIVQENAATPAAAFIVSDSAWGVAINQNYAAGASYIFYPKPLNTYFPAGTTVGTVQAVSGSGFSFKVTQLQLSPALFTIGKNIFQPTTGSAGGGSSSITGGVLGQGLVATGSLAGVSTAAFGKDALQTTGLGNNDYCDKVGQTWTNLASAFTNRMQLVKAYVDGDVHCSWPTYNAMMQNCKGGILDIGDTRIYYDYVAGAAGLIEPTGCRIHGLGRNEGGNIGSSITPCIGVNNPIAGCAAPTYCTAAATPVSGCGYNEGGAEQSAARSWNVTSTTAVATANTSYLQVIVNTVTPTGSAWSLQNEEFVQIKGSSNPTNNVAGVACMATGTYPECPAGPTYCTGAGAPLAACPGANTAIVYLANWAKSTNCAASCGKLIAMTPEVVIASGTAYNIYGGNDQFGQGLEGLHLYGGNIPGISGISNVASQEMSACRDLAFSNFPGVSIDFFTVGSQNSGPCRDFNIGYSNVTNVIPATTAVRLGNYMRGLQGFTITNDQTAFTCSGTSATHSGGVVVLTYTASTCNPVGHMAVTVAGFTGDTAINVPLAYVCLPADNASCINPTSTQFSYLVAGSGSPTGSGTVQTYPEVAVFLDKGPQLVGGGGINHVEGFGWATCMGCNAAAGGVEIDQIAGQPPSAPGVAVVYISDEFKNTTPFTADWHIRSVAAQTTLNGGLFTIWDMINYPLSPLADQTTADYHQDCQVGQPTNCSLHTTSTQVASFSAQPSRFSNQPIPNFGTGGGTANAQTVTFAAPKPTALFSGLFVAWKPTNANTTGTPTLQVEALTAKTITKCAGAALVTGDLNTSQVAYATYDGTNFNLLNPGAVGCTFLVPAAITIGSGTSITTTTLCPSANCPQGTYNVSLYLEITTACTTTGTYFAWLTYTDDQGAKTAQFIPMDGPGVTRSTAGAADTLGLTSTANFAQGQFTLRTAGGANISYGTTATACGSGGPMVGKMFVGITRIG